MHCLLVTIPLFWISNVELVVGELDIYQNIRDDMEKLNISCDVYDSCKEKSRYGDSLRKYACHCDANCVQLGTCCLDSYYFSVAQPKLKPNCRSVYNGKSYFMIDRCPPGYSFWENLCREEWKSEDDVLKFAPVTSLFTSITYKNYFCFRCHETNDEFLYWNLKISYARNQSDEKQNISYDNTIISLDYDSIQGKWLAEVGKEGIFRLPVNLSLEVPDEISRLARVCEPHVISNCSESWSDAEVSNKCQAYMTVKQVVKKGKVLKYRNMHCALCNFENMDDIACKMPDITSFRSRQPFSFVHLLDINRFNGDSVNRFQPCDNEQIWDPYAGRCRGLTCALPGYKIKNGRCVMGT